MPKGTWQGQSKWPIKDLLNNVVEIGSFANAKTQKGWSIVTAQLVSIYKSEKGKKEMIESWNTMQSTATEKDDSKKRFSTLSLAKDDGK